MKWLTFLAQRKILKSLENIHCDGIDLNAAPYIYKLSAREMQRTNFDLCAYDVNTIEEAIKLIKWGVQSITTNFPLKIRRGIECCSE